MVPIILMVFAIAQCALGDMNSMSMNSKRLSIKEAPYMAIYRERDTAGHFCGATILSERFVLSAAHCYREHTEYYVKVGIADIHSISPQYEIEETILHPNWDPSNGDYNVLVLKLRTTLKFDDKIQSIQMIDSHATIESGEYLDTFGFKFEENSWSDEQPDELLEYLHKMGVSYMDITECRRIFKQMDINITNTMVCVGEHEHCQILDGSPLVYKNVLVGVFIGGGCDYFPGVYASVTKFRGFIDQAIRENYKL